MKYVITRFIALFTLFFSHVSVYGEGLLSGTMVKRRNSSIPIEQIKAGDKVISYCFKKRSYTENKVLKTATLKVSHYVQIKVGSEKINVTTDHKFYLPLKRKWVIAQQLKKGDTLLSSSTSPAIVRSIKQINKSADVFDLSIKQHHNFLISQHDILVHNFAIILVFAFEGLAFEFLAGASIGATLGTIASWLSYELFEKICENKNRRNERGNSNIGSNSNGGSGFNGGSNSDDLEDPFDITKKKIDKKGRHPRFGKFFRDSETGDWWSRDQAGHGGSSWKIFREAKKGLEWVADGDKFGSTIAGKHKGPIGRFIPWKEIKILS